SDSSEEDDEKVKNKTCLIAQASSEFKDNQCWVLEDFTTYCCWFNIGAASEDLMLLRKIEENRLTWLQTIAAQRKFRAAQRSAEIRSRPPTKSQLRNLMMTYLKNMGGYKYSQLKAKSFKEIKGMYERQKKSVQDFVPIGSAKEEELIKKMNKKATDGDTSNREKVLEKPDSTKVEVKQEGHEDSTRKRPSRRLKMKDTKKSKRQKTNSDLKEEEQLKAFFMIVPDEEGIIDYEVLEKRLVAGIASEDAYTLLRFIQKQINEYESHDGGEKDL
ncbi:hypothetical protein Tco_0580788, partial [Tanacetum coccineum]